MYKMNSNENNVWCGRLRERKTNFESVWHERLRNINDKVSYTELNDNDISNDVFNEIELLCKQSKNIK